MEEPTSGERRLGHNVTLDYYAQQQAERLQGDNTVYQEIAQGARLELVPQLRTLLGAFLFSGDAIEKRVSVLSGGEKSRLALAKMLLQPSNLLILDEPTNHLDIRTKDVLREALLQFGGAFVIVSHDRYFLKGLVNKVMEMRNGELITYPGSFEEFLAWKERQDEESFQDRGSHEQGRTPKSESRKVENKEQQAVAEVLAVIEEAKRGKTSYEQQKAARADRQKREKRLAELEKQVAIREERKRAIEALMADGSLFSDPQRAKDLSDEYETLKQDLEGHYTAWSQLAEEIEA
jgi:ATP-binding cassette subfamily F protein 3